MFSCLESEVVLGKPQKYRKILIKKKIRVTYFEFSTFNFWLPICEDKPY